MTTANHKSSANIRAAIDQIAADNTSGAAEILSRTAAVFSLLRNNSSELKIAEIGSPLETLTETCVALVLAQPDMSPLLRLASDALSCARGASEPSEALKLAEDSARIFIRKAELGARDAALHGASLLGDGASVLTHSRSSTVLAAFVQARGRCNFSVVATESRPMLEGRTLAEQLDRSGISVTIIADAAAALAMDRIDLVLVGADKLTPTELINKIGTRMIALAARERGLPIYSLCDSTKFICEDYKNRTTRETGITDKIWQDAPRGLRLLNPYFEPTPLELFSGIVAEDGVLSVGEAARRAEEVTIDPVLVERLELARKT